MKALLPVTILLKDFIIKPCFFNYICCKALNGRYKNAAVGLFQGNNLVFVWEVQRYPDSYI